MGDRPAPEPDEIEVTPEMIEVGVSVLCAWEPKFENEAEAACNIYRAMTRARRLVSTSSSDRPDR